MARKTHVTHDCGKCMGKLMHCSIKCASPCGAGNAKSSHKCKNCVSSKCHGSFYRCAGVKAP